ncbi:hypothetical protein B0H19DRAFT_1234627 [Mycena capillaripes]|nr:hypothetical protein B0H19DRAFT_1234627 [Mycena capillaripes]
MGRETCDTLKNFENPPEVSSLKIPDEPENAPITSPMTETCHVRENSIFWAIFANFVTFPTHSKIPSVTRDRFSEGFLNRDSDCARLGWQNMSWNGSKSQSSSLVASSTQTSSPRIFPSPSSLLSCGIAYVASLPAFVFSVFFTLPNGGLTFLTLFDVFPCHRDSESKLVTALRVESPPHSLPSFLP